MTLRPARIAALAFALACGSTDPRPAVVGSYDLAAVNGAPIPAVVTFADVTNRYTSGLLVISPDGQWSLLTEGSTSVGGSPPSTGVDLVQGTWRAAGNIVTLTSTSPPTAITATYASGVVTFSDGGVSYRYVRR